MPIDRNFRTTWSITATEGECQVWHTGHTEDGRIYGTTVGVHLESCIGCMKCLTACPTNVFDEWNDESGNEVVLPTREIDCIICLICEIICPTDAISIEREGGSDETLKALLDGE